MEAELRMKNNEIKEQRFKIDTFSAITIEVEHLKAQLKEKLKMSKASQLCCEICKVIVSSRQPDHLTIMSDPENTTVATNNGTEAEVVTTNGDTKSDSGSDAKADAKEEPKEVIAKKVTGTVKWFNVKSGYGFINRNDTKEDVFVHQTAIIKNNPKKVRKGQ